MVTRLSDPYGECEDPSDVDKTLNAYSEHYPVTYTAHVSIDLHSVHKYNFRLYAKY